MDKIPFFSIVIANYNYGHMLGTAIESVLHQDCNDYELIIVDGASTDNSVEVIKKYQNKLAWWVSEPDKGQSNAFNKGFSHAKGKFLTWLNADDILLPGTLKAVKRRTEQTRAEWVTGNFLRFNSNGNSITEAAWGPHILPNWLQGKGRPVSGYGPTAFWSQNAYKIVGPIDETLHFTMDSNYWIRMTKLGFRQVRVNHYCWGFRMHEESKTAFMPTQKDREKLAKERLYSAEKYDYHPTKFWRYTGWLMRILDGSFFVRIMKRGLLGKKIDDVFKIDYPL